MLGGAWLQEGEALEGAVRSAGFAGVQCIYDIVEAVMHATGVNIFHDTMLKVQAERELRKKQDELKAEAKAFEFQKEAEAYGWNLARAADEEECNCGCDRASVQCIYDIAEAAMQAMGANLFHGTMLKVQAETELRKKDPGYQSSETKTYDIRNLVILRPNGAVLCNV